MYLLLVIAKLYVKTNTCSICIKLSLRSSSFLLSLVRSGVGKIRFYREEQFLYKWVYVRSSCFPCKEIPLIIPTVTMGTQNKINSWGVFPQHWPTTGRPERYLTIKHDKANIMPKKLLLWKAVIKNCLMKQYGLISWFKPFSLMCPMNPYAEYLLMDGCSRFWWTRLNTNMRYKDIEVRIHFSISR